MESLINFHCLSTWINLTWCRCMRWCRQWEWKGRNRGIQQSISSSSWPSHLLQIITLISSMWSSNLILLGWSVSFSCCVDLLIFRRWSLSFLSWSLPYLLGDHSHFSGIHVNNHAHLQQIIILIRLLIIEKN